MMLRYILKILPIGSIVYHGFNRNSSLWVARDDIRRFAQSEGDLRKQQNYKKPSKYKNLIQIIPFQEAIMPEEWGQMMKSLKPIGSDQVPPSQTQQTMDAGQTGAILALGGIARRYTMGGRGALRFQAKCHRVTFQRI